MRIGILTGEYPPMQGGIGAYARILAQQFIALGHEVRLLSGQGASSADPALPLTTIPRWNLASLRAARGWARDLDVVNVQYQTAAFGMSPVIHFLPDALRGSAPVITTFHDLRFPYLFPKAGALRPWIVRRLARASAGVIATNHEDQARLAGHPRSALIPIGSNILKPLETDFDPAYWRVQAGAAAGDFLIGYFGLINRSKGLETLLDSAAALRAEGHPIRLLLIGGAGSSDPTNIAYMDEVDARIARLGLAPYIHRIGYTDDEHRIGSFLSASDAVVLPFYDGASYRRGSLMAAIQYGCAIVTTTPSVPIPVFRDGDNLLLHVPGDVAGLTDALRRLIDSPDLRARLRRGTAGLASTFDWKEIARQHLDFYRRVAGASA